MPSIESSEIQDAPASQGPPISEQIRSLSPSRKPASSERDGGKERRNPSVTPRKFKRFFTPRSQRNSYVSSFRQPLHPVSNPSNSQNATQSSPIRKPPRSATGQENNPTTFPRDLKRRKLFQTPESSPEHTYLDGKQPDVGFMTLQDGSPKKHLRNIQSSPCERIPPVLKQVEEEKPQEPLKRITQIENRGLNAQLLQLSIGASARRTRQNLYYPANDWQNETASFCSRPDDIHIATAIDGEHRVIPFSAASCNTNSLVAVGDEEGKIRLLDSAPDSKTPFEEVFLSFQVHRNAIIDMQFSSNDRLLVTASGDQTARVVDMNTQTTFSILAHHRASLKQVRFAPASDCILATSSRDGSVKIWDLRCRGDDAPKSQFNAHVPNGPRAAAAKPNWARPVNSIVDAHRYSYYSRLGQTGPLSNDAPSRGELPGRAGDMSVTAISFLTEGREHLLLTASEGDAVVKLWDIRFIKGKRKDHVPLSQTRQPESHNQWRSFGINSLNLNGAGTRLYTLCKDNTVYTYSTAHLILGHAPELSWDNPPRQAQNDETKQGLGPMYGFRHPQLHATSFYVKSAVRLAKDGKGEMLAVGSTDGCAVLFPTDERYLPAQASNPEQDPRTVQTGPSIIRRPGLRRAGSGIVKVEDDVIISTNGTPLVRGHDREVGSLCWTHDGQLVTVGDDFVVRCWRENGDEARDLRMGGEEGGRRWGRGWADVTSGYDEDDD